MLGFKNVRTKVVWDVGIRIVYVLVSVGVRCAGWRIKHNSAQFKLNKIKKTKA